MSETEQYFPLSKLEKYIQMIDSYLIAIHYFSLTEACYQVNAPRLHAYMWLKKKSFFFNSDYCN